MDSQEPTRDFLQLAANRTGRQLAQVGDFYDVVEELTRGYARQLCPLEESDKTSPSVAERSKHRYIELQIAALVEIRSVAENILEWRVDDAREELMTWQDIADAIGVSRQAAHTRYSKRADITEYPPL